jgi:hypothetical protein
VRSHQHQLDLSYDLIAAEQGAITIGDSDSDEVRIDKPSDCATTAAYDMPVAVSLPALASHVAPKLEDAKEAELAIIALAGSSGEADACAVKAVGSAGKLVQLAEATPRTFEEDLAFMFPINVEHAMDVGGDAETRHDADMHFDASEELISIFRDACPLETDEKPPSDKQKAFMRFQMKASTAHINMVRTSREALP